MHSPSSTRGKSPEPEAAEVALEQPVPTPPETGFGQLWHKTYQVRLQGVEITPEALVATWKEHFGEFWPEGNRFSLNLNEVEPGALAVSDLKMPGGPRLFTGVVVAKIEPTRFSFVTVRGHTFAAIIDFSAFVQSGATVAQIEIVMRAGDPLFEIGLMLGGAKHEDAFWTATLAALAHHVGASGTPTITAEIRDRSRQWRRATNVVHNAFVLSSLALVGRPFRAALAIGQRALGRS